MGDAALVRPGRLRPALREYGLETGIRMHAFVARSCASAGSDFGESPLHTGPVRRVEARKFDGRSLWWYVLTAVRNGLPACSRGVELGAQPRTGVWPSAFPDIGRPGCAPTLSGHRRCPTAATRGHAGLIREFTDMLPLLVCTRLYGLRSAERGVPMPSLAVEPMCPAEEIVRAVDLITNVVHLRSPELAGGR